MRSLELGQIVGNKQKGESQNSCFWKQSTKNFPKNECTYQGVKNVRFLKNLTCFVFGRKQRN